jgi:transcriptional regulator with XRE-family HTH domain
MARGAELERKIRIAMAAARVPSIRELAKRAHILPATLYAWFGGRNPPKAETLQKVATVLGVGVGDLWDYEPVKGLPTALNPALVEIRAAVAAGVVDGVAQALAAIGHPRELPPPRRPRQP